ncbi:MAG TPA: GAF domain-containing protein, partial [Candidatus Thermoplasmatota archaeon]|nr:GAF domain-containing protein [Candidatus Thermoplasmatota archaeon]
MTVVPDDGQDRGARQRRVLEAIAEGVPLPQTLELVTRLVEADAPGLWASILVLEGDRLLHGAAPSLPQAYNDAIHGLRIGPGVGSCGTAAYSNAPVVVEDVETHPYWEAFRHLTREHGLRACWSTPIRGRSGEAVGTFALYHREPRAPTAAELRLVGAATHLASVAIQHERLVRAEAARIAEASQRAQLRE